MKIFILLMLFILAISCKEGEKTSSNNGLCNVVNGVSQCPPETVVPSEEQPFSIAYIDPQDGVNDFGVDESITIQLSGQINSSSLIYNSGLSDMDNIILKDEFGEEVLLEVTAQNDLLRVKPMFSLTPGRRYNLELKTTITDMNSRNLSSGLTSSFGTANGTGSNPGTNPMLTWANTNNSTRGINVTRFELHYGQASRNSGSSFNGYDRVVQIPVADVRQTYDSITDSYSFELRDSMESNRTYYYSMTACNEAGCSGFSDETFKHQP